MTLEMFFICKDRSGGIAKVSISEDKLVKDLKIMIGKRLGKDYKNITLKRGVEELRDNIELDMYEFGEENYLEIFYRY